MATRFQILLWTFISLQIPSIISQSSTTIILTPDSISSLPDISVDCGPDCTVTDNAWLISVASQTGADLTISLGPTYGFHSAYTSTIAMAIQGSTDAESYADDCDMQLIFAVGDLYFAHSFHLDYRNTKYKECPKSSLPLISRDVVEMVEGSSPDRYQRFCNNSVGTETNDADDYWVNVSPVYNQEVQWPMDIVLQNDPNADTVDYRWSDGSISSNGQIDSQYTSSFAANQGLDIYIAGDSYGETFTIDSIEITYSFTGPPTTDPTMSPVPDPTSFPSNIPSTAGPTSSPIPIPSTAPTMPTEIPSVSPSDNPSGTPTERPTTLQPTGSQSQTADPGVTTTDNEAMIDEATLEISLGDNWMYVVAVSAMLCLCILCCFVLFVMLKNRRKPKYLRQKTPKVADWANLRGSQHRNRYGSNHNGTHFEQNSHNGYNGYNNYNRDTEMIRYSEGGGPNGGRYGVGNANGARSHYDRPVRSESREQVSYEQHPNRHKYSYHHQQLPTESPATESSGYAVRFKDNLRSPESGMSGVRSPENFSRNISSHVAGGAAMMDDIVEHMHTARGSPSEEQEHHLDVRNNTDQSHYTQSQLTQSIDNGQRFIPKPIHHAQMSSDSQIYEDNADDHIVMGNISPMGDDDEEVMKGVTAGGDMNVPYISGDDEGDTSAERGDVDYFYDGNISQMNAATERDEDTGPDTGQSADEMQTAGFIEGDSDYNKIQYDDEYYDEED